MPVHSIRMVGLVTIEREFGCGAASIASHLAERLGWKRWDHLLTEEIARIAKVDPSAVKRCDEPMESRLHRLAKVFWRGNYQPTTPLGNRIFDTDPMLSMMHNNMDRIRQERDAVVVARGGPFVLREHS